MPHRPERMTAAALIVALAIAASCGGDGDGDGRTQGAAGEGPAETTGGAGDSTKAGNYARAERAMRADDYDTAIRLMRELGGYRDARKRGAEFRLVAARETLANARRKLGPAPQAAVALTRTSLRYHPTREARAFLNEAQRALKRFQRRERAAGRGD